MEENVPMGLAEDVEDHVPAKDVDGVPYCRVHHCRMTTSGSGKRGSRKIYCKCPVPDCGQTGIKVKTPVETIVPPKPQACPRCSGKRPVYCERDGHASDGARVVLKCPQCGWKSTAMAVPQLVASRMERRQPVLADQIGGR